MRGCVRTRRAVAAAACKKREDEAANGGDGLRDAASDTLVETPTVEDAEGPDGVEVGSERVDGMRERGWRGRDGQGGRVDSPSSATLQAPALPYSCGPYLGFLAATLL